MALACGDQLHGGAEDPKGSTCRLSGQKAPDRPWNRPPTSQSPPALRPPPAADARGRAHSDTTSSGGVRLHGVHVTWRAEEQAAHLCACWAVSPFLPNSTQCNVDGRRRARGASEAWKAKSGPGNSWYAALTCTLHMHPSQVLEPTAEPLPP